MNIHSQPNDTMRKVAELVKGINVCMLSASACGRLISHPMNPLELDARGDFWFFSSYRAATQIDLSFINIGFSDEDRSIFISLSGRAELLREQARIDRLWTPAVKPWFQLGSTDPDLTLMKFTTQTAAYWDRKSSRMVRLIASMVPTKINIPQMREHEVLANVSNL